MDQELERLIGEVGTGGNCRKILLEEVTRVLQKNRKEIIKRTIKRLKDEAKKLK